MRYCSLSFRYGLCVKTDSSYQRENGQEIAVRQKTERFVRIDNRNWSDGEKKMSKKYKI